MVNESVQTLIEQPATAVTVASLGDKKTLVVPTNCTAIMVKFLVSVAFTVTAAVIKFDRRPTPQSDTGRGDGDVGVLTAPTAAVAIGRTLYKFVQVDLKAGDEVVVKVTTAASAGDGYPSIDFVARAENPLNDAEYLLSA